MWSESVPQKPQNTTDHQNKNDNLNSPISSKKNLIFNLITQQKIYRPKCFNGKFHQTFKEELIPLLYHHFQKMELEATLLD